VLVDVSGLRVGSSAAVQVFPSVLPGAGGWPAARLVLFGAGAELARTLTALRVTSTVPLAADENAARLLLDRRPPVLSRHLDLDRDSFSLRRARMFVRFACADWQLDPIRADAVAVASELVANALEHAGPACRLALRYRADGLTIAVYDHNLTPVFPLRSVAESHRGGGPSQLAGRSSNWGIRNGPQEKWAWVLLPTSASADHVHTVRAAAQDAARVMLARGAGSPDAAHAVQQLLASLAAQHGRGFIQEVVDELAAELADASAAIAPSGPPDRAPTAPTSPRLARAIRRPRLTPL
jgi:hypothetical protein